MIRTTLVLGAALALVPSAAAANLDRLDVPRELKVISYYPTNAAWTEMWTNWEPNVIARDLERAVSLDANTVRVIVQPDAVGWPNLSPVYANRLAEFVSMAADHGLHVQLTLFDWWYRWSDIRDSEEWVRELLTPYIGDPRIAFVELRNEILPKRETDAWARLMIPYIRELLRGETAVTISVAGRDPLRRLAMLKKGLGLAQPDFYDMHYFGGEGATAYDVFARAKEIAAPTPLWIGETGYSTLPDASGYGGVPDTTPAQEALQSRFLESVNWAARANGLPPVGVWVLDDLVPAAVPNRVARDDDPELHYGLFRVDGTAKPAAGIVRAAFDDSLPLDFNGGFEDAVPSGSGIVVPAQWEMSGRDIVFTRDTTVAASGVASARLAPYAGGGTGSFSLVPPDGGVRRGTPVRVSASAQRTDPNGQIFLVIEWRDGANRLLRRDASAPLGPDATTWTTLTVSGIAPRNAAYARIDLVAQAVTAPVWFDDVSFSR